MSPTPNERAALLALNFYRLADGQFNWNEDQVAVFVQDLKAACAESGQDVVTVLKTVGAGLSQANPMMVQRLQEQATADERAANRARLFNRG